MRASPSAAARALTLVALAAAAPALAEPPTATTITPLKAQPDVNAVNLTTGLIPLPLPSLSVPAAPRLRFETLQAAVPTLRANLGGGLGNYVESSIAVHTGASTSELFKCQYDDACTNEKEDGSVIGGAIAQGGPYSFVESGSGATYAFDSLRHDNGPGATNRQIQYYASSITYPDGEVISLTYDKAAQGAIMHHRLTRLASSVGYHIDFSYAGTDVNYPAVWGRLTQATLVKASAPGTPLGQLTYGTGGGGYVYTITDLGGRTFGATGASNSIGAQGEAAAGTMMLPGEAANSLTVADTPLPSGYFGYPASIVSAVTRDGVTWNYAYTNLRLVSNGQTTNTSYSFDKVTVTGPNGYNTAYTVTYAGKGVNLVTATTDALGRTTGTGYDANFRLGSITFPEGNSVQLSYDAYGNVVSKVSNPKSGSGLAAITESSAIDAGNCASYRVLCFRPTSVTDGLGRTTANVYDTAGRLIQRTDPADAAGVQKVTYLGYGASYTAPTEVRVCALNVTCGTAAEFKTQYSYVGASSLPATETVFDGVAGTSRTTAYTYDAAGRVTMVDGPLPGTDDARYFRYDVHGRKTWEIGPVNTGTSRTATRTTYRDADDKVTLVETGWIDSPTSTALNLVQRSTTGYDSRRYPVRVAATAPDGTEHTVASASFDDRGQAVCATVRMNPAAFGGLPADACTLGTAGSQGPDRVTRNSYDAAGQLTQVQKAYGTPLQQVYAGYGYTLNGKQSSVTDANGNLATMGYDGFDRLARWTFPSKTAAGQVNAGDYEAYGYDAAGNRTSLRKRDGVTLTYSYDALNRVSVKSVPGSASGAAGYSVYYGYDVRGLQIYARFGSGLGPGVTTGYDGYGAKTSETSTMGGVTRTLTSMYDAGGARVRLAHPDGNYVNTYRDAAGRVYYADLNAAVPLFYPPYDNIGRPTALYRWTSTWAVPTSYGYDPIGRLASLAHVPGGAGVTSTFGYNPASQIASRSRDNDAYAWNGYVPVSRAYAVNGLNQYTSAGPASFTYDANGNLTSDGTTAYVYDAENRLVSASNGTALSYDPLGRLDAVTKAGATTRFTYDGDQLTLEHDGSGTLVRRYVHGDGADDPQVWYEGSGVSAPRYLYADHQGSVTAVADANGTALAINAYDDYGIPEAGNLGRFGYTGQAWLAELGLWYYKARIYSPTLGRFLQVDPIGYADQNNLYAYVGNDPINGADPTGMVDQHLPLDSPFDCSGRRTSSSCSGDTLVGNFAAQFQFGSRDEKALAGAAQNNSQSNSQDYTAGSDGDISLSEANQTYRQGDGRDVYQDASKLTVEVGGSENSKRQSMLGSVTGTRFLVHGTVTLLRQSDGSYRVKQGMYNFDPKEGISVRNGLNFLGHQNARLYMGRDTPFMIKYYGTPKIIYKGK